MEKNSIVRGATALAMGAFLSKLIGAIYRIPFTNLLGGEGLGLYQMVFPVYCVLLDFAGAGVPNAISKIIAGYKGEDARLYANSILKSSIKLLVLLGILGTLLMLVFSYPLASLQGNENAYLGYIFLAPAVFFVSLISAYRGYFQGKMKMHPTAISQIIEQLVKAGVGIIAVYLLLPNVPLAVGGATFAVSLAELIALLYLVILYKKQDKIAFTYDKSAFSSQARLIVRNTVPITLIGILIPLSQVIDSFLVVNILSAYRTDATALYGLLTGTAMTVINLPVALCYGLATVAVPAVSSATDKKEKSVRAKKTLSLTLLASLPCAVMCFILAPFITNLLFSGISAQQKLITANLLRILSPAIVLLSVLQTQNAVLIGNGKLYHPLVSMGTGILVKILLSIVLLPIAKINIYGGAVAIIACYFIAVLINLTLIIKKERAYVYQKTANRRVEPTE